jgi:uncharacterized protein
MRLAVLFVLLIASPFVVSQAAHAASFDCKRAATPTERAICADPKLSSLDDRAIGGYTASVEALGLSDDERDPMAALLLKGHEEWAAARNRCGGATNCLLQQYLRRVAVLDFKPDSQARSPVDPLLGRYGTSIDPPRELVIMAAPGGVALVHIAVTATDWTCAFTGIGRPDKAGGLRVVRPDFDGTTHGEHAVLLTPTRLGLAVVRADPKDDVSAQFCGAGGALEQPFPRRN